MNTALNLSHRCFKVYHFYGILCVLGFFGYVLLFVFVVLLLLLHSRSKALLKEKERTGTAQKRLMGPGQVAQIHGRHLFLNVQVHNI
jgi:uncharacterized membrane protein